VPQIYDYVILHIPDPEMVIYHVIDIILNSLQKSPVLSSLNKCPPWTLLPLLQQLQHIWPPPPSLLATNKKVLKILHPMPVIPNTFSTAYYREFLLQSFFVIAFEFVCWKFISLVVWSLTPQKKPTHPFALPNGQTW